MATGLDVDLKESQERAMRLRARAAEVCALSAQTLEMTAAVLDSVRSHPWRCTSPPRADLLREVTGLRQAMESRAVIEQAKGIIMSTAGCDADTAFELLRSQSQHTNRKLRDLAGDLVADATRRGGRP